MVFDLEINRKGGGNGLFLLFFVINIRGRGISIETINASREGTKDTNQQDCQEEGQQREAMVMFTGSTGLIPRSELNLQISR